MINSSKGNNNQSIRTFWKTGFNNTEIDNQIEPVQQIIHSMMIKFIITKKKTSKTTKITG